MSPTRCNSQDNSYAWIFAKTRGLPMWLRKRSIFASALILLGGSKVVPSGEKGTLIKCQFLPLIIVGNPGSGGGSVGEGSSPSMKRLSPLITSGHMAALVKTNIMKLGSAGDSPCDSCLKSG